MADVITPEGKFLLLAAETAYNDGTTTVDENDLFYAENLECQITENIVDRMPASGQRPGLVGVTTMTEGSLGFTTELCPKTITSNAAVVPSCHPILISTGWKATHDAVNTKYTYTLTDYSHGSFYAEAYEWDETRTHAWKWIFKGVRGNGVIKWTTGDRALIEFTGNGVESTRSRVASAAVPDLTAGSGFYTELPIVHEDATATLTEQGSSGTLDGCLLDVELRPKFTVNTQKCGDADGVLQRIYLTPDGHAEIDIQIETTDSTSFDAYALQKANTKIRAELTWTDLSAAGNTVHLDCYFYISGIDKDDDVDGRQVLTLNGKLAWSNTVPGEICTLEWETA